MAASVLVKLSLEMDRIERSNSFPQLLFALRV